MRSEQAKERYRRWREENHDKVRAQRQRRHLRKKGLLPPWEKPVKLSEEETRQRNIERLKVYRQNRKEQLASNPEYAAELLRRQKERDRARYERLKANPEALEAARLKERNRKRLKRGIPLDAPVMPYRLTDEERERRKAEKERLKAERAAARAAKPPKMTPEERKERRRLQQMERDKKKRDLERQKRAAEVANAMASYPTSATPPKVCPDPPELQALFAKASKGQPPMHNYTGKKMGAFTARVKWL